MKIIVTTEEELARLIDERINKALDEKIALLNPPPTEKDKLLSRKEVADILQVTLATINEWSNRGLLKRRYVGSRVYFYESDLEELLGK